MAYSFRFPLGYFFCTCRVSVLVSCLTLLVYGLCLLQHGQPWSNFVMLLERKVMIARIVLPLSFAKLGH